MMLAGWGRRQRRPPGGTARCQTSPYGDIHRHAPTASRRRAARARRAAGARRRTPGRGRAHALGHRGELGQVLEAFLTDVAGRWGCAHRSPERAGSRGRPAARLGTPLVGPVPLIAHQYTAVQTYTSRSPPSSVLGRFDGLDLPQAPAGRRAGGGCWCRPPIRTWLWGARSAARTRHRTFAMMLAGRGRAQRQPRGGTARCQTSLSGDITG
jgi:hypothetical protein